MYKAIRKWKNYLERKEMKKKKRRTEINVNADFIIWMN
jgi:hypothetical protein